MCPYPGMLSKAKPIMIYKIFNRDQIITPAIKPRVADEKKVLQKILLIMIS